MPRPAPRRSPTPAYPVPTPAEEAALVQACLDGGVAAWRRLLSRYEAVIHAIPRRFGLDDEDTAEVYQNVCLALHRGLPRLRLAAGLTRWVLTTTRRQSRDLARKRRREKPSGDPEELAGMADGAPSVAALMEEMEQRVALRAAIDRLPPRCADLLRALYLEEEPLSYRQIGERFGIPEGTIGPTRARCLARLREILEKKRIGGTK